MESGEWKEDSLYVLKKTAAAACAADILLESGIKTCLLGIVNHQQYPISMFIQKNVVITIFLIKKLKAPSLFSREGGLSGL